MGLAAPWALVLGVLAVLPVIAHLVRRRDVPEVALPTIALLERARVRTRRRARLVDVLLLLLRVAIVLVGVVALAAPYTVVRLAWGDGRRASVALVVDDSFSMGRRADGHTLLASARDRAVSILASLPEGSEATVVLAGAPPRVLVPRTSSLSSARAALVALAVDEPTRGTDVPGAVLRALRELAASRNEARSVVVLSDAATHAHLDALPELDDVGLEVVRIVAAPFPDVAVRDATVIADPLRPGAAQVIVTIRASGGARAAGRTVRVQDANGRTVASGTTGDEADGLARVAIPGVRLVAEGADPRARVQLVVPEGDALPADDVRGLLLRSSASIHVVVVAAPPDAARAVVRALDLAPDDLGPFSRAVIDPDALSAYDLGATDVVLLLAPPPLDAGAIRALRSFVTRGGGLAIAGGEGTDEPTLAQSLAPLLPCAIAGGAAAEPPLGLHAGDPATGDLDDTTGLADAAVRRRLTLDTPAPGANVPLRFTDGTPALVVGRTDRGHAAVLATSLDESWSDLPLRPGFLPLVVRLVRVLAGGAAATREAIAPGSVLPLSLPPGARTLFVEDPRGERVDRDDDGALRGTLTLGAWRVLVGDDAGHLRDAPRLAFVVAVTAEELDLTLSPPEPASRRRGGEQQRRGEGGSSVRRSLGPWVWLLVGLLVIAEGLARLRSRRLG